MTSGLSPIGTDDVAHGHVLAAELDLRHRDAATNGGDFDVSDIGIGLAHGLDGLELTRK